ncbi:putative ATP-dependent RNA helicase [Leptomonas pyrrhocoris]|uniref:RNA helicase n=1 Tax=Leptomonas pyrrhocoris TaxID=157538 RepID=A0A0M9G6C6_LEPPY|nr:putative ATP-dependent RNA helicase [Leptomonas pyrrhocoris]KPA83450.1 putative ATP-dependent RNA helicase [Leptomonas pyrrhocoris]|eukprot:XP_015661889.1 putative ATP-dependent RNA helicase [Leptomonas pyrrhocoris]
MPKKPSISFADLGLGIPLPSVLAKSRDERRKEQRLEKKAKQERTRDAMAEVAAARDVVARHKRLVEAEGAQERTQKEQRKRELFVEHLRARNEREEAEVKHTVELVQTQERIISEMKAARREEEQGVRRVREMLEKEVEEKAKTAPTNVHIDVDRTAEVEQQREGLPVLREEQPIMEAINGTSRTSVLVCGETGSGKTTQIPQFLWEAGYGHAEGGTFGREGCILVTEPRRVAAVSMARRVAEELNVTFGEEVCYHVRYDNNLSDACKLKFATEGIVLKEIQSDFLLKKYSVIVIDEAHERSISCDILVGLLSRIVPLRNDLFQEELRKFNGDVSKATIKPLKLVIMSATMRVADFKDNRALFPVMPPLINVEARRYPVTNHFARRTELKEYVDQAFDKVRQMHKKLPPGGILVFLCTQQEINDLCDRLRHHYAKTKIEYYDSGYTKHRLLTGKSEEEVAAASSDDDDDDGSDRAAGEAEEKDEFGLRTSDYALDDEGNGDNREEQETVYEGRLRRPPQHGGRKRVRSEKSAPVRGQGLDEDETRARAMMDGAEAEGEPEDEVNGEYDTLHVLPLYALLDFQRQQEVFKPPPKGTRLCVVATNVAETSITIPNIKYVVDAGRSKTKVIDEETRASCFRIEWTSQASAEQRSGRAGRVGPGHCYRLYSTAVYSNLMPKHGDPEVLRTPLDSVVLLMKHVGVKNVGGFPFPSPPRETDLKAALQHLNVIGALDRTRNFNITPVGRSLVAYPVPPRFARAVLEALQRSRTPAVHDMVAAIVAVATTTTTVFTGEGNQLKARKLNEHADTPADPRQAHIRALLNPGSDLVTYLNAFRVYNKDPRRSCAMYCLVQKSMHEAKLLYAQLRVHMREHAAGDEDELADTLDEGETVMAEKEENPSHGGVGLTRETELLLREVFIPGLMDQIARRATVHECRSLSVEYNDKRATKTPYLVLSTRTIAYIHPTSSVARTFPPPELVTFGFLQKVRRSDTKEAQAMMMGVTVVTPEWLRTYGFEEEP